ncbi:MAG: ubiquinol-cytochrome c reductase iron-sulfur subunit, partial [Polyangiaceae bacterium]
AICTHQGCRIGNPDANGKTTCPCHGAQFDGNGAVLRSPARSALVHYAVAICGGHVFVDSSTTVDAGTRATAS